MNYLSTLAQTSSLQPAKYHAKHETPSLKTSTVTTWCLVRVTDEYGAVVEWSVAGQNRFARKERSSCANPFKSNLTSSLNNEVEAPGSEATVQLLKQVIWYRNEIREQTCKDWEGTGSSQRRRQRGAIWCTTTLGLYNELPNKLSAAKSFFKN